MLTSLQVTNCRPKGGPWSFVSRLRTLAGGQILEDIDQYNSVHDMFSIFNASDGRENDYAEGFGNYWEHVVDCSHAHDDYFKGVPVSSSQTVRFKPLSGMIKQRKYLPNSFMLITK